MMTKAKDAGYCTVFGLRIVDGQPDLSGPVKIEYRGLLKPGSKSNAKRTAKNPETKCQWETLIGICREEGTLEFKELTFQDGLPHGYVIAKEEMI